MIDIQRCILLMVRGPPLLEVCFGYPGGGGVPTWRPHGAAVSQNGGFSHRSRLAGALFLDRHVRQLQQSPEALDGTQRVVRPFFP